MNYDKIIEVHQAIGRAFENFKHYSEFTKRALPHLEKELPEYTVVIYINPASYGKLIEIRVWGNGIAYNDPMSICFTLRNIGKTWQEEFIYAWQAADVRDYKEREGQEETLIPALTQLEKQVEECLDKAEALVKSLPVPTSANVRKHPRSWERPSLKLAKRFPLLF